MPQYIPLEKLDAFANGAVNERFTREMQLVVANIIDPNTDAIKPRTITMKMTIKPTKDRKGADVGIALSSGLAPYMPIEMSTRIGINEDGEFAMVEEVDQIPGQIDFEGNEQRSGNVFSIPINNKSEV